MSNNKKSEREVRLERLNQIRSLGLEAYPAESNRTHVIKKALEIKGGEVVVSGRIMATRAFGKLIFCKIQDESG